MATASVAGLDTSSKINRGDWILLGSLTLIAFAIHLALYRGYGFFRDELYFIACGHHLAWGFVDQPPGVAVVAWASRHLLGDTLFAIRFVPVLFGAAEILLVGLTAKALGGRRFAILLGCLGVLAAPEYFGSYLNTDMFMELGWTACAYIATLILAGGKPRLWIWFGVVAGLAMQGKHAMVFFGFAFVVALLISPQRKLLLSPWPFAGGVVAFLIVLPNLIWEYRHHWATLELLQNIAKSDKNVVLGPWAYFIRNVDYLSSWSFPVWFGGILWCLFAPDGKRFRAIGWTWVVAFITFVALKGKDYYLAPVYPALFAAGAVAIESLLEWQPLQRGKLRPALAATIVVVIMMHGILSWPFAMPMMPVERFIAYEEALHVVPHKTETMELSRLPQQYADMFGWPEMAAAVARVYNSLPPEERAKCGIYGSNYGDAGAIDYFGRQYGLPHAISGHQNYWLWGPAPYTGECMIVISSNRKAWEEMYSSVVVAGETDQQYAIPFENHKPIMIVRGPKFKSLADIWPRFKAWI